MTQQTTPNTTETPHTTPVELTDDQVELICYAIRCAPVHDTTISLEVLSLLGEVA